MLLKDGAWFLVAKKALAESRCLLSRIRFLGQPHAVLRFDRAFPSLPYGSRRIGVNSEEGRDSMARLNTCVLQA
ncbi:MAG: hypothetical protein K6G15_06625 [Desulfovibrio sp.]|nr:hypothetical protein [Desulfovibrio sp.]